MLELEDEFDRASLSRVGRRIREPPISELMSRALANPRLISLAAGFTDNPSLPVQETRELLEELLADAEAAQTAMQYGTTAGDPELRRLTLERILRAGKNANLGALTDENVVITHGSQQLLYLVNETLLDPGDVVLVEDPTYFVYIGMLQAQEIKCRGIRMQPDGLDLNHLHQILEELKQSGELPRLKLFYMGSYFQNPSGITTGLEKKLTALKILKTFEIDAGHPIYLLEDAAYMDLSFEGDAPATMLSIPGAEERTLFTGTYSKPYATGIRVGFGILPEPILSVVRGFKGNHDFGTANFLQQILARAIRSGRFDSHLAELRRRYQRKAEVFHGALRAHFPEAVEWTKPGGGLYIWAGLPAGMSTSPGSAFFQRALENEVLYVPGEFCYVQDPSRPKPNHEMRLSFGSAPEASLAAGAERLGKALKAAWR